MPDTGEVTKIVSAYAKRNALPADQLPQLIAIVHSALARIESGQSSEEPQKPLVPAVSVKRSVQRDTITCLDCGKPQKMLKRHLLTSHQLTPDQYRQRWGLSQDYPLVAPGYAAKRSELAKSIGLGRRPLAEGQAAEPSGSQDVVELPKAPE